MKFWWIISATVPESVTFNVKHEIFYDTNIDLGEYGFANSVLVILIFIYLLSILNSDICLEFWYYRGGWASEPRCKIMKNGEFHISVENKGGKKYQGGQKEYCLTDLLPSDVITIELDSQETVSD